MLSNIMTALNKPTPNMSWLQLGAATVFVLVVIVMWRQVVLYIMDEI
jgi:hypothetical protein